MLCGTGKHPNINDDTDSIGTSERGAPSGQKKGLFQMTDYDIDTGPCIGTLWHG